MTYPYVNAFANRESLALAPMMMFQTFNDNDFHGTKRVRRLNVLCSLYNKNCSSSTLRMSLVNKSDYVLSQTDYDGFMTLNANSASDTKFSKSICPQWVNTDLQNAKT